MPKYDGPVKVTNLGKMLSQIANSKIQKKPVLFKYGFLNI